MKRINLLAILLAIFSFSLTSTVFAMMIETPVRGHSTIGDLDSLDGHSDTIVGFNSDLGVFSGDPEFPGDFTDRILNALENPISYINFQFPGFTNMDAVTAATLQMNVGIPDAGEGASPPRVTINSAAPGSSQIVGTVIGVLEGPNAYANYAFNLSSYLDRMTAQYLYFSLGFNYPTQSGPIAVDWIQLTATGIKLVDDGTGSSIDPVAPVPEPATMLLVGTGLIGLIGVARKQQKKTPKS